MPFSPRLRMHLRKALGLTVIGILLACVGAGAADPDGPLPPSEAVAGWALAGEPRTFTPGNLYEYINGAADLFLAYGFCSLAAGSYLPGGDEARSITVDVYDMGEPLHAYGIWASERPEDLAPVAGLPGSYQVEGLIAFRRGAHYVKVSALDQADMEVARALARLTAERLSGCSELPTEFRRLPAQGRLAESERYVRKDALGHRFLVEVISADYQLGKATAAMHVADLGSAAQAAAGWERLRSFEQRANAGLAAVADLGEAAFAVRDAGYGQMVCARQGRFLVVATSDRAPRADLVALVKAALRGLGCAS